MYGDSVVCNFGVLNPEQHLDPRSVLGHEAGWDTMFESEWMRELDALAWPARSWLFYAFTVGESNENDLRRRNSSFGRHGRCKRNQPTIRVQEKVEVSRLG